MRNASEKSCRGNPHTHFVLSNSVSENLAVHKIMWQNMVQPDGSQFTILRNVIPVVRVENIYDEG
jgi:hypothetical protein